ncbi:MAG: hypothetical protein HKM24_03415 [Gammaproteobacteria bacterium]|nr:hypothetical protein [Gammaproteobacteria bacterium]
MSAKQTRWFDRSGLVILVVLFVAVIMLSNVLLRGLRVDLTENNLYTVTKGTKNILKEIDEPINLYYFFSDRATANIPRLRDYATHVRELLEEFESLAKGKIKLSVLDPVAFSEQEDQAKQYGLQALMTSSVGEPIYLGLAGSNAFGDEEIIPIFEPDAGKEAFLEYELAKLIYTLDHPEKKVVGVISGLPLMGSFDPMSRQQIPGWVVMDQIKQLYETKELDSDVELIDDEVDVLMVVHPKDLPASAEYAIDQFVLSGKPTMIFVDPNAELDTGGAMPNDPMAQMAASKSSDLERLFDTWGVEYSPMEAVLDEEYALRIDTGSGHGAIRHVGLLGVVGDGVNQQDVATSGLSDINFSSSGFFKASENSKLAVTPLIQTSAQAMVVDTDKFRFMSGPESLSQGFVASGERYTLAGRLQGAVSSAFNEGPPGEVINLEHKDTSSGDINVLLVADTDVLSDRLWVSVNQFFGQRLARMFANNGAFFINSLDNFVGSKDLIGVRGRKTFQRPFKVVENLRSEAEEAFRATEERLQNELRETETKLTELQSQRSGEDNLMIMTAQQSAEIKRFQDRQAEVRKELRKVRHSLNKDIEALGKNLKVINIGLVPLLLTLFAVWFLGGRSKRLQRRFNKQRLAMH